MHVVRRALSAWRMKMAGKPLSQKLLDELKALRLLPEADILTDDAQEVSDWKRAVRGAFYNGRLDERGYDVRAIANWFLAAAQSAGRSMTNLYLNKLVYFAVERALIERSLLLTPAKIEAWDHGPVFREIYHSVKGSEDRPIRSPIQKFVVSERRMAAASENFLDEDLAYLQDIYAYYGHMTAAQLRALSHMPGEPWDLVWNHKTRTNFGMHISSQIILAKARRTRSRDGRK